MDLLRRIFKPKQKHIAVDRAEFIGGNTSQFTAWCGDAYSSDIFRAGVDAIARNAGKLKGGHVIDCSGEKMQRDTNSQLDRLLQVQPNPHMNAFDMLYKLVTHTQLYNNGFAYLQRSESGDIIGIYPVIGSNVKFMADATGQLFCKFIFRSGRSFILPYADIIHIRRHFNSNDFFGDSNAAILPALELSHTQNEGIVKGIKNGANIRGVLTYNQLLSDEKLKASKDKFVEDYLAISNDGGVIAVDAKMEYTPITLDSAIIDDKQLQATKTMIFNYLGLSESIVNSNYTEDEWAAFYASVIEPIALQLSLEFTRKIFSDREQAFGNSILFESGRLQYTANKTKVELLRHLLPYGVLTINQALQIMNLPTVPDGDRRLQALNLIDASIANDYQKKDGVKNERD